MKILEKIYRLSNLLKVDAIKKEVDDIIEGFNIQEVSYKQGIHECIFTNSEGEHITLSINPIKNDITIIKQTKEISIRIHINQYQQLSCEKVEYRPSGIIYTITYKVFDKSKKFNNEDVLVDLMEESYTFSKDTLSTFIGNAEFSTKSLNLYLLRLSQLKEEVDLSKISDYHSSFSTHMNYYLLASNGRQIIDNNYPTKTYLNGEDISSIYEVSDTEDKLYQVYDLYHGIINPRNENSINLINLGLLSIDAFDLKTLRGITNEEDRIVGEASIKDEKYLQYLKDFFYQKFAYHGNLELTRESILIAITYKPKATDLAKREVEKVLGISYEEFEQLDFDEQRALIKEKTGKEPGIDCRYCIDCIPIDEDHIVTMEDIDKRIDKLGESLPKRILKKIFQSKKY